VFIESFGSGLISGSIDFGSQEAKVWSGEQNEIDWGKVFKTAGVTASITAGAVLTREGVKQGVYE
jgi:hypothetical protein